jgi:hypothetical protein
MELARARRSAAPVDPNAIAMGSQYSSQASGNVAAAQVELKAASGADGAGAGGSGGVMSCNAALGLALLTFLLLVGAVWALENGVEWPAGWSSGGSGSTGGASTKAHGYRPR